MVNWLSKIGLFIGNVVGYTVMTVFLLPLILVLLAVIAIGIPLLIIFGIWLLLGAIAGLLITKE